MFRCSNELLSRCFRDKSKLERCLKDPTTYTGKTRLATGMALMKACEEVQARVQDFKFPMLIFHGLGDRVTAPALSRKLFTEAPSTDKTYITFEKAWHSLWFDTDDTRTTVFEDITRWIARRGLGSTGPVVGSEEINHLEPASDAMVEIKV